MDRYADDIAELLDACSVRRAVIAGCSMGGYISFAFWRRHRERVLGLALCDTRPGADGQAALVVTSLGSAVPLEQEQALAGVLAARMAKAARPTGPVA